MVGTRYFLLSLLVIPLLLASPVQADPATEVDLFQITSNGSQQSSPLINRNLVVYTNFGGSKGIDIWGYNTRTEENFPIIEKDGEQFLTGFHGNFIVYENTDVGSITPDVRLYHLRNGRDTLVAGGAGAQTSGVTNGEVVVYINGGACGSLHVYDIEEKTTEQIFNLTCHPVRIWDDIVVFPVADPSGTDIKGYDLGEGSLFEIATEDGFQEVPSIFGDKVVYLHRLSGALGDYNAIKVKDLDTGKVDTVYESDTTTLNWPAISNKYVVWSESSAMHIGGVQGADLRTGEVFEVQEQGAHQNSHTIPAIWKNTAVWQAWRTGNGDIYGATFKR